MTATVPRLRLERVGPEATATPLELFFDLVFVFALTQVTAFMAHHPTYGSAGRGLLVLGVLWWCWVGYAWLGNVVKADEGACRVAMLAAMAAMFVIALAVPEAFDDAPGGLSAPYAIAAGYLVLRVIHIATFWVFAIGNPALRRQLLRFAASMLTATALLTAAAAAAGDGRTALWAAALLADYAGTYAGGASGWHLSSAGHFAERHGLIVLVALGESIVAIGVGVGEAPLSWPVVAASILGLAVSGSLWWLYFDTGALLAERALASCPHADRARLARDAYSFLHLPMIAGVVLLAFGMKKVLEGVADPHGQELHEALGGVGLTALVLGASAFVLAQAAFYARCVGRLKPQRLALALGLLPLLALGRELTALATLATLAGALVLFVAWETRHFADARQQVRHSDHAQGTPTSH